jgi:hypothetical protein
MKRLLFCLLLWSLVSVNVWANTPSAIEMDYLKDEQILHVVIKHISLDTRNDYLRRVLISKNGEEVKKFSFSSQKNTYEQVLDVPLELKAGDVIKVLAVCTESGPKEETLTIIAEESSEK